MGKDNTRNDIDGIIRRQIKAGERIFKWLDGVTGENEPFQSVFFEGEEEDKPIMCRMSSMMGRPYRIYTQIKYTLRSTVAMAVSGYTSVSLLSAARIMYLLLWKSLPTSTESVCMVILSSARITGRYSSLMLIRMVGK